MKLLGVELVCGRPTLAFGSVFVHQTKQLRTAKENKQNKNESKAGSWYSRASGYNARITHNRHNRSITSQKKMHKEQLRGDKTEMPPWDGQQ